MTYVNIRVPEQRVSFPEAVCLGLGRDRGLFLPERIQPFEDVSGLLDLDLVPRSARILSRLIGGAFDERTLDGIVASAFDFPLPVARVEDDAWALELFHGPSLAFKDFGARFMAQCLARFRGDRPMTILTATSGDTGAAVAHAFLGQPGIDVVVLYPLGRVTPLQEKLFCTLGGNVRTYAVRGDFDACQSIVKRAFSDADLVERLGLNSANSINVARLLAQVCYYFEAVARLPGDAPPVFSVPSGNFGNVTAGLIACALGLPAARMIAATNVNDTVPRFLADGRWRPNPTVATLTNAMDVAEPNNFSRIEELGRRGDVDLGALLRSVALGDPATREALRELHSRGYLADPHSALAWRALRDALDADDSLDGHPGVFLCTAHPAKFVEDVERIAGVTIELPEAIRTVAGREVLSEEISPEFDAFRDTLLRR